MRYYLGFFVVSLSMGFGLGLECKVAVSEEECSSLHERYQELMQEYERVADRMHINPSAYQLLHSELARTATFTGQPIPGSTEEQIQEYAAMYSDSHKKGGDKSYQNGETYSKVPEPQSMDYSVKAKEETEANGYSENTGHGSKPSLKSKSYGSSKVLSEDKDKKCHDFVPKDRCDELLSQYAILKELYGNETTKKMLDMDAYNDLHRDLTEAGLSVDEKNSEHVDLDMACHSSIGKLECDVLLKKYKLMKQMYSDDDLMEMLNPDAYTELHREMKEAGLKINGTKKEGTYNEMSCDSSVPKEECNALLKKYKLMKEMYSDASLKEMLNPNAYNDLKREMEEAGLETEGMNNEDTYNEMSCDSSVPKEECEALLKKYELMKEMYNDADLRKMLNPDSYNELHREMEEAGLKTQGESKENHHKEMSCDSSVPKEECDALLKKYELMKEMYNDADLKKMLNPDAYTELHREMEEAGLQIDGKKQKGEYTEMGCDSSVPKEECDALLKKYKLMKELYNDADLKKMLNPDAYNELHREMEKARLKTSGETKKALHNDMTCDSSVPKEECDVLLKKYKLMKQMYTDEGLMDMLNPDAYNELHRELEEAGINIEGKAEQEDDAYSTKSCYKSVSKERCDALLKKYSLMKEMYSDEDLKGMLNPDAYSELHREMEEAGIKVDRSKKGKKQQSYPLIRQCNKDGLYRYDDYSFIFCTEGFGFVQRCPQGTMNGQEEIIDQGYGRRMFCNTGIQYIRKDLTETVEGY